MSLARSLQLGALLSVGERQAVAQWFASRPAFDASGEALPPRSPLTNQPLETRRLTPNIALKQAIVEMLGRV